jgi:type VI secretion system secreted protein VgrG
MPEYNQENRIIAVQTPLGDNVLLLQKLTGAEGISRLFTFYLDMLSENPNISFTDIVGQRVTITIHLAASGKTRYVNGFVSRFVQTGKDNRFTHYQAEVVPWLWFLTRNANCRMFQQKTPVEIIKKVFSALGFSGAFKDKTQSSYETREYCVQYRETDYNFVSRLMEQYGIFYYFEHELSKHTLVMADAPSGHPACPNQETAAFDATARLLEEERVTDFQMSQELKTGAYSMNDYNFETPLTDLDVTEPTVDTVANNATFELYDFPGDYTKKPDGEGVAKVRMQEQETTHLVGQGASTCGAFTPGYKFDLKDYYRKDLNQSYVLTVVQHNANCGSAYYTGQAEVEETYENHFVVIPYSVPYRPVRGTPRPIVQGPQPAVVVGPSGEEIYVDKYGRVKVQFFWDREGKADENSSCWIRVSQLWAGTQWGAMWIPRIGQEVIVDFLEGDPDRPLIMGRVYNADQMPPYTLPDEKTKSTIKSYSSKGGGGFNEIRIEDKKGKEQIFIHGEKDQDVRIKNVLRENIGADTNLIVGGDQREQIAKDKHIYIKGDHDQKVDGSESLKVGSNLQEKVGQKFAVDAGQEIHLKAGMKVVIEAGTEVTLKVGGNFIDINSGGIFIKGTMVFINSGGSAGSGSGCNPDPPKDPADADKADPGEKSGPPISFVKKRTVTPPSSYSPQALVLKSAADSGAPFCDI